VAKIELKAVRKTFDSTEVLTGIDLAAELAFHGIRTSRPKK